MGGAEKFVLLEKERTVSPDRVERAVSYLLGCEVRFESYDEIEKSLKPFSLEME